MREARQTLDLDSPFDRLTNLACNIFGMPHASKAGIVGIFVVVLAAIAFVVAPGIVDSILGNGCI